MCGYAWAPVGHVAYYYLGMTYKAILTAPVEAHPTLLRLGAEFHHVLLIAFYLPIVTLGIALVDLAVRIALGRTAWPRWFAVLANPVSLLAIGRGAAVVSPEPLATLLNGPEFNRCMLAIYLASTVLLRDGGRSPTGHRGNAVGRTRRRGAEVKALAPLLTAGLVVRTYTAPTPRRDRVR